MKKYFTIFMAAALLFTTVSCAKKTSGTDDTDDFAEKAYNRQPPKTAINIVCVS